MRTGMGAAWPAAGINGPGGVFQGIAEYSSTSFVGRGSLNPTIQSPTDLTVGVGYLMLGAGVSIDAGWRNNTRFDTGNGNHGLDRQGFTASITYTKPGNASPGSNHFPIVVLETDHTEIAINGSTIITATGFDADDDRLTYAWRYL